MRGEERIGWMDNGAVPRPAGRMGVAALAEIDGRALATS